MKAWLAMNIRMGLVERSEIDDIWSTDPVVGDPFMKGIMSRHRYWAINRYFHIADNAQAVQNRNHPNFDPMYKVRFMIDLVNERFAEVYKPGQCLSVDEAMIKFKGRHHAKQYMPKKPIKWGFKVWMCAESDTGYALRVQVYEGKARDPARLADRQQNGLGFDVVKSLTKDYQGKNHIVYYDRFFSSVALARYLLTKETYVNSTEMLNRKGLPPAAMNLKLKKGQPCRQFLSTDDNVLVTVFHDKRQISHLSTGCQPGIDANVGKPIANCDYNKHMGGVDLSDQHKSYYAVGRKARKWWRCIVWYLFNIGITNAYLVWRASTPLLTAALTS